MSSNPTDTKTSKKISLIATAFPSGEPNHSSAQTAQLKVIPPTDILVFVPGTTDPGNTSAENHQSNKGYFRDVKEPTDGIWFGTKVYYENLWQGIMKINPLKNRQFLDLHIEDEFFSWSGDNNHDKRVEGAERLLDLLKRDYPKFKNKSTHLHLIGHSHGGNVINEFTNLIVNNPNFPEKWRVKSITYLSTPFFQKQHQLNHTKLHPNCTIINVHNDYDLTQRVIADFTLKNLEVLIRDFSGEELDKALKRIKETNTDAFDHLGDFAIDDVEGPFLWSQTTILLDGIQMLFKVLVDMITNIQDTPILSDQRPIMLPNLIAIRDWAIERQPIFLNNSRVREGGYGNSEFIEDLDPLIAIRAINALINIQGGIDDSNLLNLLASMLQPDDDSSISHIIDDTSTSPEKQVKGMFKIVDIPIFTEDPYHSKNRKANFDRFVNGLENCVRAKRPNMLQEVLMRIISQFITEEELEEISSSLNKLEWIVKDDLDTEVMRLGANVDVYTNLVARFNADLMTEEDREDDELAIEEKPGSIPYLAMVSHSLSHTKFWDELKKPLMSSFSSGKNPSYKPNKE